METAGGDKLSGWCYTLDNHVGWDHEQYLNGNKSQLYGRKKTGGGKF